MNYKQDLTPVAQVVSLLKKNISLFTDLGLKKEHIHAYKISNQDTTTTDPIVVASELPRSGHISGNNIPVLERRRVQLIFYYPLDYEGPEEGLEQAIKSFLLSNNIFCYQNAGHVMTPDSENITNTLKFNFMKEIN